MARNVKNKQNILPSAVSSSVIESCLHSASSRLLFRSRSKNAKSCVLQGTLFFALDAIFLRQDAFVDNKVGCLILSISSIDPHDTATREFLKWLC